MFTSTLPASVSYAQSSGLLADALSRTVREDLVVIHSAIVGARKLGHADRPASAEGAWQ